MAGTSSAKTRFALLSGHDEKQVIFWRLEPLLKCCVSFGQALRRR
jgi:hypothetical protein